MQIATGAGSWTGTASVDGDAVQFQAVLSGSGSSLNGTYALAVGGLPLGSGSVTSTDKRPSVRLSFRLDPFGFGLSIVWTYMATVNDTHMSLQGMVLCPAATDWGIEPVRLCVQLRLVC